MNRHSLCLNPVHGPLARGAAWLLAMVALASPAWAAGPAAGPAPSQAAPHASSHASSHAAPAASAKRVYLTVAGDTLDRVIRKTMADSPLKDELLRQAFIAANPKAFAAGRNSRLKPGTELSLPDTQAMLRDILLPLLSPTEVGSYFPPPPSTADERRRWVRYP